MNEELTFEQILKDNMRYIQFLANKLPSQHFDDLVAVGQAELWRSYNSYTPDKSTSFMKYAGVNVKNKMISWLKHNQDTIRIPTTIGKTSSDRIKVKSTSTPINEDGDVLADVIAYDEGDTQIDTRKLKIAIKMLKPKEMELVQLYYGIDIPNEERMTMMQLGEYYGLTFQAIEWRLKVIKSKLRNLLT